MTDLIKSSLLMNDLKITADQIFAHRGASGHAPENTLSAFKKAYALGARSVEFDCMLTKDGRVVVHHDENLQRTAGLADRVCDLELADLLHADVGSWFSASFKGETIPQLIDVIALLSKFNLGANVEIKPCSGFEAVTGEAVAREIVTHWPECLPSPIISSFSEEALLAANPVLLTGIEDVERAILWDKLPEDPVAEMKRLDAQAVHCHAPAVLDQESQDALTSLRSKRCPLRAYTVNDTDQAKALFAIGATAIFTDFPDRFLKPAPGS